MSRGAVGAKLGAVAAVQGHHGIATDCGRGAGNWSAPGDRCRMAFLNRIAVSTADIGRACLAALQGGQAGTNHPRSISPESKTTPHQRIVSDSDRR